MLSPNQWDSFFYGITTGGTEGRELQERLTVSFNALAGMQGHPYQKPRKPSYILWKI